MKYAVVILVVLLGVWLWRKNRADDAKDARSEEAKPPRGKAASAAPQIMLSCAACGVHLPESEAISGKKGSYCSLAHRLKREG